MTTQEIIDYQNRLKEFQATEIGAAFIRYERLRDNAWQADARLEYTDVGHKTAKEAWKKSDEARTDFLKLLGYNDQRRS